LLMKHTKCLHTDIVIKFQEPSDINWERSIFETFIARSGSKRDANLNRVASITKKASSGFEDRSMADSIISNLFVSSFFTSSRIIKLTCLPYDDRTRTNNHYLLYIRAFWHISLTIYFCAHIFKEDYDKKILEFVSILF